MHTKQGTIRYKKAQAVFMRLKKVHIFYRFCFKCDAAVLGPAWRGFLSWLEWVASHVYEGGAFSE